ncbi:MAG: hypothetical protein WBI74_00325 [Caldicoprobacterales bacterium]|nr:hypothetical protein [Clostridiales bacterium]
MYNNEDYYVRYSADSFFDYNQIPGYGYYNAYRDDHYGKPPGHYEPYPPIPCPEYPPVQPTPPVDMMPGMRERCLMHLRGLLESLMHKKVSLIIEGVRGTFDCIKIISVDDCTVVVETKNGVCVIPINEITAICMSKEVAKDIIGNMD